MSRRKDTRNEWILHARDAGVPVVEIARQAGISRCRVGAILRRMRLPPRPEIAARAEKDARICEAYRDEEKSISQVGRAFGTSDSQVTRVLKRNGIPRRSPGGRWRKFEWEDSPPTGAGLTETRPKTRGPKETAARVQGVSRASQEARYPRRRPRGEGREADPVAREKRDTQMCKAYNVRISTDALAREHRLSLTGVRRILKSKGVLMRPPGRPRRRYAWEEEDGAEAPRNLEEDHI
jgi:Mor family transcriptional regulator